MTDDIVTRLRSEPCGEPWCDQCKIYYEAADEIQRLRVLACICNRCNGNRVVDNPSLNIKYPGLCGDCIGYQQLSEMTPEQRKRYARERGS